MFVMGKNGQGVSSVFLLNGRRWGKPICVMSSEFVFVIPLGGAAYC